MLRMIALEIMALSLRWGVTNAIARVIKVIGYSARRFNFIANSIARIVINPILGTSVICAVVHVVWAIAHVVG